MLPKSYRKLRYIENESIGSYINIDLLASLDMQVIIDGYVLEGNTALFGARTSTRSSDSFVLQSLGSGPYRLGINTVQVTAPTEYSKGNRYHFDFSNEVFTINGKEITRPNAPELTPVYPLYVLGAMNDGGSPSSFGKARIYSIQFYRGEQIVSNLMPCISDDGIYGVYDHVRNLFYGNSGTGSLIGEKEPYRELVLTGLPKKLHYLKGEAFDPEGLLVSAIYESGYRNPIEDYQISGFDSSVTGTETITVSCEGVSASFDITISDIPVPELLIPLADMKQYLRIDFSEDDDLITGLIYSAQELCADVARMSVEDFLMHESKNRETAVLYAVAYLYEHREEADHNALDLTLRALLFGMRKEGF